GPQTRLGNDAERLTADADFRIEHAAPDVHTLCGARPDSVINVIQNYVLSPRLDQIEHLTGQTKNAVRGWKTGSPFTTRNRCNLVNIPAGFYCIDSQIRLSLTHFLWCHYNTNLNASSKEFVHGEFQIAFKNQPAVALCNIVTPRYSTSLSANSVIRHRQ